MILWYLVAVARSSATWDCCERVTCIFHSKANVRIEIVWFRFLFGLCLENEDL
jgi:hypothetical protein